MAVHSTAASPTRNLWKIQKDHYTHMEQSLLKKEKDLETLQKDLASLQFEYRQTLKLLQDKDVDVKRSENRIGMLEQVAAEKEETILKKSKAIGELEERLRDEEV